MYNLDISALGAVVSKSIWPPESENIRMVKNCVLKFISIWVLIIPAISKLFHCHPKIGSSLLTWISEPSGHLAAAYWITPNNLKLVGLIHQ